MGYTVKGDILLEFSEEQEIALALAFPSFKANNDSIFNGHIVSPRSKTIEYFQQALEAAYFTYVYDCTGVASIQSRFRRLRHLSDITGEYYFSDDTLKGETRAYGADFDSKWYSTTDIVLDFLASLGFGILAEFEGEDGEKWVSYNPLGVMTGMETHSIVPILSLELDELIEAKKQILRIGNLLHAETDEEELDPKIFLKQAKAILTSTKPETALLS